MFAAQIIIILLIVSGLIAFIGDRVGHQIGRKRLSLFGLRPRYTAIAVTVITGILITLFTGTILSVLSADVRTAVFGLDKLKDLIKEKTTEFEKIKRDKDNLEIQLNDLRRQLDASKKEVSDLNKTKDTLSKEMVTAKEGLVIYKVGDVITTSIINAGEKDPKSKLTEILTATDSAVKKIEDSGRKHYIEMPSTELDEAALFVSSHEKSTIVRIVSAANAVYGEAIPVHFELFENLPVFNKGDKIASAPVDGIKSLPEIEQSIKDLLGQVSDNGIKNGMIPDSGGTIGNIPYSIIFDTTRKIKSLRKKVVLSALAKKNTDSAGPLELELKIE